MDWKKVFHAVLTITIGYICIAAVAAESARTTPAPPSGRTVEVLPVEDLMREHGLLSRVLLAYDNIVQRLNSGGDVPAGTVGEAGRISREFIEDYHEKLEKEYVFPRFKDDPRLGPLVTTLDRQHQAGRKLTDEILRLSASNRAADRAKLSEAMSKYVRMYRPHAAREDTVLFPAFHAELSDAEYRELGGTFEGRETALFGEGGFGKMVARVAALERQLGLNDLNIYTP